MQLLSLMIHFTREIRRVVTIIACFVVSNSPIAPIYAQSKNELSNLVWDRQYGDEKFWTEYKAMAVSKGNEILIAIRARNTEDLTKSSLWLWRINQNGEKVAEIEIKKPQKDDKGIELNTAFSNIKSLTVLENGDAFLIIELVEGRPWIVRIDQEGDQSLSKEITKRSRQISIFKIIPTADGNYLLLGHESFDALAMKINVAGTILWESKKDRGRMELFVDGISTEDGGFFLIGNSGDYDILRRGPSVVWVGKYDADGKIKSEKTFTGRYGSVSKSPTNGYTVIYDRSNSDDQEIWVQSFSPDLKGLWESQILAVKRGFSNFKIATLPSGDFIAAGAKDDKPYVLRIGAKGNIIWSFWGEAMDKSADYDLISSKDGAFFIVSSIFAKDETNQFKQKIRVIKFFEN